MRCPAWSARTVHVPAPTSVIVWPLVPLEVQTAMVVVEKETGSPDDAVALTVTGDCSIVRFGGAPNVIVWFALAIGVTAFEGSEAGPVPTALVAVTVKV